MKIVYVLILTTVTALGCTKRKPNYAEISSPEKSSMADLPSTGGPLLDTDVKCQEIAEKGDPGHSPGPGSEHCKEKASVGR